LIFPVRRFLSLPIGLIVFPGVFLSSSSSLAYSDSSRPLVLASRHGSRPFEACENLQLLSFVQEVVQPTVAMALLLRNGVACSSCPSSGTHAPPTPCASTCLSWSPYGPKSCFNGALALDIVADANREVRPPPSLNSLLILFRPKSGRSNASHSLR
jgi:hypothetical protein